MKFLLSLTSLAFLAVTLLSMTGCKEMQAAFKDAMEEDATNTSVKSALNDGGFSKASPFAKEKDYEYVLDFRRIPKDPKNPGMMVTPIMRPGNNPPIILEKNLYCHSRDIEEIELVPSPSRKGFYQLALRLSDKGKKRWASMSGDTQGQPIAICLDGEYQRYFYMTKMYDGIATYVVVPANFSERLAKKIKGAARKNYKHFNRSPFQLF